MKCADFRFVGNLEIYPYGTYLNEKSITDIIAKELLKGEKKEFKGLVQLRLAIEPIEDAGLKVEVEE